MMKKPTATFFKTIYERDTKEECAIIIPSAYLQYCKRVYVYTTLSKNSELLTQQKIELLKPLEFFHLCLCYNQLPQIITLTFAIKKIKIQDKNF